MKIIKKLLLCAVMAFVIVAIAKTPVKASTSKIGKFYQDSCTINSVTLKWTKPELGDGYTLTSYTITDSNKKVLGNLAASKTSCKIDYDGSYAGTVYLYYYYTKKNHNYSGYYYANVNTYPPTATKDNFGIKSINSSTKKISVKIKKPGDYVSGAQLEVYKGKTRVYKGTFSSVSDKFKIAQNAVYNYRVRYYYKNTDPAFGSDGQYYYGPWSDYRSFDFASASLKTKSGKKGFYVKVKKVSGISSYTVYVKTSSNGEYKKVKTLKNKSYTVAINSKYKKKATNYVQIIPNIKGYGKSDIYSTGSIYVYK